MLVTASEPENSNDSPGSIEMMSSICFAITTVSFGEERPIDPAQTEEAYAKNRRAEFDLTAAPATWSIPTP